jgi:integrase
VVPGNEVKNGTPIDAQLPKPASDLISIYIDTFRPLLAPDPSDHLIPGMRPGMPKSDQGTRTQIQQTLANHVGIEFHPHAFRHLAAYLVLKENPEAHGLVQRLLGHNSLHATMTFYSGLETDAAIMHHDALIARHRQAAPLAAPSCARAVR